MSRRAPRPRPERRPRAPKPRRCGKRWFADRISAELAIARISYSGKDRSGIVPRRAYACPACKGWHLTSQEPRSRGSAGTSGAGGSGTPMSRRLPPRQAARAYRTVAGIESWVAAAVAEHLDRSGRGPTWRELEAVFGWSPWEGAPAIRSLLDRGWLREGDGGRLLPGEEGTQA